MARLSSDSVKQLTFPCKLGAEKVAIRAASTLAQSMGFDEERVADICLAVAEACTNAVEHGSLTQNETEINVVFRVDGNQLDIQVQNPNAEVVPPAEFYTPDIHKMVSGENEPGGMGLFLIQKLMDVAEFIKLENNEGYQFHMIISKKDNLTK